MEILPPPEYGIRTISGFFFVDAGCALKWDFRWEEGGGLWID